jgi:hypothetical protein
VPMLVAFSHKDTDQIPLFRKNHFNSRSSTQQPCRPRQAPDR